jgi:hypothetical protein
MGVSGLRHPSAAYSQYTSMKCLYFQMPKQKKLFGASPSLTNWQYTPALIRRE